MNHKEFILELTTGVESAIDRHIARRKAMAERRAPFIKLMSTGLAEEFRAQYGTHPPRYRED